MGDAYARAKSTASGKLKLKRTTCGGEAGSSRQKSKKRQTKRNRNGEEDGSGREEVPVVRGSGRVVSSGVTLQGFETKFKDEIEAGDEVMVHHPSTLQVESRTVVGVMSLRSLTLTEPFTSDLISTTSYHIKKDSERLRRLAEKAREKEAKRQGDNDASSLDGDSKDASLEVTTDDVSRELQKKLQRAAKYRQVTYREKTGMWGYRTVTQRVKVNEGDTAQDDELGAEKILDIRAKKMGRDKFCW